MKYRKLGNSGLYVSEISYGTMFLGGAQFNATDSPVTEDEGKICIEKAISSGITYIDTADIYGGFGPAEEIIGRVIKPYDRSELVLASKVCIAMDSHINHKGLSRKHIFDSINGTLTRLQTDYIDIYYCHRPDWSTPLEETVRTMNELIERGEILHWATSNWPPEALERAYGIAKSLGLSPPVADQTKFNLFTRYAADRGLSYTIDGHGLGIVAYKVLSDGAFTGYYSDKRLADFNEKDLKSLTAMKRQFGKEFGEEDLRKLKSYAELAKSLDMTPSQLAYAWTLKHKFVSSAIMSTRNPNRIEENLGALEITLNKDTMKTLDELYPHDPYFPTAYNSGLYYSYRDSLEKN